MPSGLWRTPPRNASSGGARGRVVANDAEGRGARRRARRLRVEQAGAVGLRRGRRGRAHAARGGPCAGGRRADGGGAREDDVLWLWASALDEEVGPQPVRVVEERAVRREARSDVERGRRREADQEHDERLVLCGDQRRRAAEHLARHHAWDRDEAEDVHTVERRHQPGAQRLLQPGARALARRRAASLERAQQCILAERLEVLIEPEAERAHRVAEQHAAGWDHELRVPPRLGPQHGRRGGDKAGRQARQQREQHVPAERRVDEGGPRAALRAAKHAIARTYGSTTYGSLWSKIGCNMQPSASSWSTVRTAAMVIVGREVEVEELRGGDQDEDEREAGDQADEAEVGRAVAVGGVESAEVLHEICGRQWQRASERRRWKVARKAAPQTRHCARRSPTNSPRRNRLRRPK